MDVHTLPNAIVTSFGSIQPVYNTGEIGSDILDTMKAMGADPPYTVKDVQNILEYNQAGASLRAEAGYSGMVVVLFHTRMATLPNGRKLLTFLTLNHVGVDALYWNVMASDVALACSNLDQREALHGLIEAGSGASTAVTEYWHEVPTASELSDLLST